MKKTTATTIGLTVLAMLTLAARPAAAKHGGTIHQKSQLEATGLDDNARGLAKLEVKNGTDGRLDLQVNKLDPHSTYDVLVDGVKVGSISTGGGGGGRIRFRSRPRSSKDLLLGFDPRGATIVVEREDGAVVLQVTLEDTPSTGGVICCVPDDSGSECEDRTDAECTAAGGTVSTATSCLPNPCGDVTPAPGDNVICCTPDDSGPECEDRSSAGCAAEGGVVVQASSCDPNPCAPATPPTDPDIQCCTPDNSAFECEDRTPAACAAAGGVDMGAGTCTPDPCASLPPPVGGGVDDHGHNGQGTDDGPGHN